MASAGYSLSRLDVHRDPAPPALVETDDAEQAPGGVPAQAMAQLAAAMGSAGGAYRLDLYLDERYEDEAVKTLGVQRLAAVEAAVSGAPGAAQSPVALEIGKTRKDKHPRLEIVRRK